LILARPCTADGSFLDKHIPNPTPNLPHATSDNPWAPFPDRLAFDWAHYHYVRLQSSASDIHVGLDLWRATIIKHESEHGPDGVPWSSADELYATIDSITIGGVGWKTCNFYYTGPKPPTPPQWMEKMYELNLRDVLAVLKQQVASAEFNGQFEYLPYEEYDGKGDRIHSHLMSAYWANREAVWSLF
jgi:Plavaka transposase